MRHLRQISTAYRRYWSTIEKSSIKSLSTSCCLRSLNHYPIDNQLYGLTDEQIQLRETVFNFCQKELEPHAYDIDKNDDFPQLRDFWTKLGHLGLLGITADPEYGGSGLGILDHCLVLEEMSRVHAGISLSYGAHSNLCVNQINEHGTPDQKLKWLPSLCQGQTIGALAMSEAGSGSDVVSMRTTAEKQGEFYILNGSKFWITNGPYADVFVVYAKTDPKNKKPQHGITAFVVEKGMEGFKQGQKLDKLGLRGSGTAELVFEDCKVPEANILGGLNRGVGVMMSGLDIERTILAAGPLGVMQACCDIAWKYAHEREQFGQKIAEFQLIQGKMADMYATLGACRSYMYNVARQCDLGRAQGKDCAASALFCAEKCTKMTLEAIQILGRNGYINDYPTGRYLRDAEMFEIGGGTSEIRRLVVGRALNKEYA